MRKNFGKKTWFYPLPVLIIGEIINVNADEKILGSSDVSDTAKLDAISFDPLSDLVGHCGMACGRLYCGK